MKTGILVTRYFYFPEIIISQLTGADSLCRKNIFLENRFHSKPLLAIDRQTVKQKTTDHE